LGKNKLQKFAEMKSFDRVFQPGFKEIFEKDYYLKGKWRDKVFGNTNPLILELGCGKGEYTLFLAEKYPDINFIGVDIKGARIWKGAKSANENRISNVAFLRTRIELINAFFYDDEVEEIWITFPDPQLKKRRNKKRLTGPRFLNSYSKFLKHEGLIHLKTDNDVLFKYTLDVINYNKLSLVRSTENLYASDFIDDVLSVKTFYEKQFLAEGSSINYLEFKLPRNIQIKAPPEDEE